MDRVYLLTGHTVAMLAQSKTLVDAAVKAGVGHIVHQGVFANWDVTDPHLVWHQMIERYIEGSGLQWTHLHPNVFMDGLASEISAGPDAFSVYWDDRRVGWIAARDIAAVAATVLRQGPARHGGKEYWLSTEVASGPEVAATFSDVLGREIRCNWSAPIAAPGSQPDVAPAVSGAANRAASTGPAPPVSPLLTHSTAVRETSAGTAATSNSYVSARGARGPAEDLSGVLRACALVCQQAGAHHHGELAGCGAASESLGTAHG